MNLKNASTPRGRWSRGVRDFGIALWVSFLAACMGSLIIFGLLDPEAMTGAWTENWDLGREWGYTLGFGFLWLVSFTAAVLTIFMVRTGPRQGCASGLDPLVDIKLSEQGAPGLKSGKVVDHEEI